YDFIQKPIDREYFVASLIRAMQARQYKRQLDEQQRTLEQRTSDLEQTVRERTRELQFLADASRILTASLDSEATLKSIARLAVPRLADMCMTFLAESDGQVRRVEVVHSDPAKEQRLRKLLERYPFNAVVSEPTATVLRTGQALLVPEISEEWARGLGPHTEELSVARTLGSVSLIIVPLVARGRPEGRAPQGPPGVRGGRIQPCRGGAAAGHVDRARGDGDAGLPHLRSGHPDGAFHQRRPPPAAGRGP